MRYFLELSYKGTRYHGWQIQENAITVQEILNQKISMLSREEVTITGSGRTDSGVHASFQMAHFDLNEPIDESGFQYKLNKVLPHDIAIHKIYKVKHDAHARFDATQRSYQYFISHQKNPFQYGLEYFIPFSLDYEKMNEACSYLMDFQDFTSFSKVKTDVTNFNCEIFQAEWIKSGQNYIFNITANRFLRGMVRAIVGTLIEIGSGKKEPNHIKEVIEAENRNAAGAAAPPEGLFLSRVNYPADIFV